MKGHHQDRAKLRSHHQRKYQKSRKPEVKKTKPQKGGKIARPVIREIVPPPGAIRADREKIFSNAWMVRIPDYYEDITFTCMDCGAVGVWTAARQKWWYEVAGGDIQTTARRCKACRAKERARRDEARRVHLDGVRLKRQASELVRRDEVRRARLERLRLRRLVKASRKKGVM
jgi:Probable zinc-ribbon domain